MASITELKEKWVNSAGDIKRQQEEFRQKLRKDFEEYTKEFFENVTGVHAITWTQYAPYFNDGAACEFTVNDMYAMDKESHDKYLEEGGYAEEYSNWSYWEPYGQKTPITQVSDLPDYMQKHYEGAPEGLFEFLMFLSRIPDDIYLATFGDHVEVILTKDGTTVREYEHD